MKILIILISLISTCLAEVPLPRAATSFEVGIAQLTGKGENLPGTSWMYHFEMQPDEFVTFFGQAGKARAQNGSTTISQTSFAGGAEFEILSVLGFRAGLATTVAEVKTKKDSIKEQEIGPMAALSLNLNQGAFKYGATVSVLHTATVHSSALRVFAYVEF